MVEMTVKLRVPAHWHGHLPVWGWPKGLGVNLGEGLLLFQ